MKPEPAVATYRLPRSALVWQFVAIISVVVPHLSYLPFWMPLALIVTMGWRWLVHIGRLSYPPHWVRAVLSLLACGGVFWSFGGVGGVNGMVALLIAGFILKSLEIYQRRDALLVVYIAYLVATSGLLFDQSIWMAAYILISVQLVTAALLAIYQTHHLDDIGRPFRTSAVLMMQALPLMLVLFVLIPRIGPLWSVQMDLGGARTGLSDEMTPGDITNLTRSSEVAFRVTFDQEPPQRQQLYWRALTYSDFDGQRWYNERKGAVPFERGESLEVSDTRFQYDVMLEATGKQYAPVLDMPVSIPQGYVLSQNLTVRREQPFNSRDQYRVSSATGYRLGSDTHRDDYIQDLTLPYSNPRSLSLARQWQIESASADAYIQRILLHFNRSFSYTLSPQPLAGHRIDQFLFDTQEGFCGHFSGAMVFMLRAAGIPARVVAGYQGGEWNPYEKYLLVRQYDAHAWVEAWLPQRGWIRLDPTAAVAPERIEQSADLYFAEQDEFLKDAPLGSLLLGQDSFFAEMRLKWDAVSFSWQRWVVNYHREQANVLQDILGELNAWRLALALLLPFGLVMGCVALWLWLKGRPKGQDPCDRALMRLSNRLERKGRLGRRPGETVLNYCRRVADVRPELAETLFQVADLYEQVQYSGEKTPELTTRLIKAIRLCAIKA